MKTTPLERSLIIKEGLDNIVKEILAGAKDKIVMMVRMPFGVRSIDSRNNALGE